MQRSESVPSSAARAAIARQEIERALTDLRRGSFVILREDGHTVLIQAAETATPDSLARLSGQAGAPAVLAVTRRRAAALKLLPAGGEPGRDESRKEEPGPGEPGGTVTLSLPPDVEGRFLRYLADPTAIASVSASPVLAADVPAGSAADAAVALTKLARLLPAAILAPLGARAAQRLGHDEGLLTLRTEDVVAYRRTAGSSLKRVAEARVPLSGAEETQILAFRPSDGGTEHLAIVIGHPDPAQPVLVRLHSECFTGDLLGSLRCDCGDQLRGAVAEIAQAGGGILLYLAQEGRGIGLVNKLRAYQLQDTGFDTVDANEQLGFDADERVYLPAAEMLRQLRFQRVRLLTNNPEKVAALTRCGITVAERVPHVFPANGHNDRYLMTKARRSGHFL